MATTTKARPRVRSRPAVLGRPREYDEKCGLWYCDAPHYSLGFCRRHYVTYRRSGSAFGARRNRADIERAVATVGEIYPVLSALVSSDDAGLSFGETVMCIYCGRVAVEEVDEDGEYVLTIEHKEACPVTIGRKLVDRIDERPYEPESDDNQNLEQGQ